MENEVMTNGCSKDHTKERPPRGPTGDQATRKKSTLGATSLDPAGETIRKERKEEEGTTGAEQDRTGQCPISPGKKEGKSEERREENRRG